MSRDIVLISSGYDMYIRFWSDFSNGTQWKAQMEYKDSAINALEITPNKDYVAFAAGNSINFIDLKESNLKVLLSINSHEGLVSNILIPDNFSNCFISAGEDCSVRINDIRAGKGVNSFYHNNYVNSVAIGNNNKDIIAADENGTIKIWDIKKGEVRTEYASDTNEEGMAFRSISLAEKDGFLVGAQSNGNVCIFDYNNNNQGQILKKLDTSFSAHNNYITKCLLSPENNMLATCSADNEIRLWERKRIDNEGGKDPDDSKEKKKLSKEFTLKTKFIGHKKWVWDCDFSLDSLYLLSCSSDKTIRIWSIESGKVISTFVNPKGVNNITLVDDADANE